MEALDANIISNTYADGQGRIVFDGDVTTIGDRAFSGCGGLAALTVDNNDPVNIALGEDVFCDVPTRNCVLYVPIGSKELYQNADQWQDFAVIEDIRPLKKIPSTGGSDENKSRAKG